MADTNEYQGVNENDYVGFGISKTTGKRHEINHLPENAFWETGIYQYEQGDKLIGGVDGIDNLPLQQLANRTLFLKNRLDEIASVDAKELYALLASLINGVVYAPLLTAAGEPLCIDEHTPLAAVRNF